MRGEPVREMDPFRRKDLLEIGQKNVHIRNIQLALRAIYIISNTKTYLISLKV